MLNPNPDTGIDSILNLNIESTSLVDVLVTTNVKIPLLFVTTFPLPPIPLIQPQQQTPVCTPAIVLNTSLQNRSTFGSLFKFEDRVKDLEDDLSKFKQTNLFAEAISLIPGIVDTIEKLVNEQVKDEVLNRSSNEAKTSHAVAADLSKPKLKKILIDKMESNKLIYRSDQQKTLYKALIDAYETDKVKLDTYGDIVTARKEPESSNGPKEKTSKSIGKSKEGSKSHQKSIGKSAQADEPIHTAKDIEEPTPQEFNTGFTEDQPVEEASQLPDCNLAQKEDTRDSFNELIDTPLDFSAFVMNQIKVDTLTPELLAGSTLGKMKGSCKSLVELKYFLEEVYKATTD
nr:hypothetical protein [Tanacetum cinerariifolium]